MQYILSIGTQFIPIRFTHTSNSDSTMNEWWDKAYLHHQTGNHTCLTNIQHKNLACMELNIGRPFVPSQSMSCIESPQNVHTAVEALWSLRANRPPTMLSGEFKRSFIQRIILHVVLDINCRYDDVITWAHFPHYYCAMVALHHVINVISKEVLWSYGSIYVNLHVIMEIFKDISYHWLQCLHNYKPHA